MSEHDDTLRKAMEENSRLRSEREESLRDASSAEFSGRLRTAERVYWAYALVLVAAFVSAMDLFVCAFDVKTLIACAVVMLVVYETTVLMKLWFATAGLKMSVLKDVKLLRLDMSRLATAVGVASPAEPPVKYEPLRGASTRERWLWLAACCIVGAAASTLSIQIFKTGAERLSDDTLVTLAADGSGTSVTKITQTYASFESLFRSRKFPYFAPKDWKVRFLDAEGREMPTVVTPTDNHNRYDVTLTDGIYADGKMQHTRISETPKAATLQDGVWTYKSDILYSMPENNFNITVCLPTGAKFLSADPAPVLQFNQDGRTAVRFQGTRERNQRFACSVRYEMPSTPDVKR